MVFQLSGFFHLQRKAVRQDQEGQPYVPALSLPQRSRHTARGERVRHTDRPNTEVSYLTNNVF